MEKNRPSTSNRSQPLDHPESTTRRAPGTSKRRHQESGNRPSNRSALVTASASAQAGRQEAAHEEMEVDSDPEVMEAPEDSSLNLLGTRVIKRTRRRLPRQSDPMDRGTKRHKMRRNIEQTFNRARPVRYRMKPLTIQEQTQKHQKRTRVTRQICAHRVQLFHQNLDPETGHVPDLSVSETIEDFLEESKPLFPSSSKMKDEVVALGIEYDDSSKMLHFGRSMKKHSCRMKRSKFQMNWWPKHNKPKGKPGITRKYIGRDPSLLRIREDPNLFQCHWNFFPRRCAPMQLVQKPMTSFTMARRDTNDIIRDSSYFVREFFMAKGQISFRITRSSDIPFLYVPPILRCGYFPLSAVTVDDKKHYLKSRYQEAQFEYCNLSYRELEPRKGFKVGYISGTDLYNFHRLGKHIHGFFLVWESEETGQRYLVDMFHFQFFPLDVEFTKWERRLRIAFDIVTTYNLHLAEIVRVNRPVFNELARNPSFFKPITLKEIIALMHEQGIAPKHYSANCGIRNFYEWGVEKCNEDYLSAYFIITGGSKLLNAIGEDEDKHARACLVGKTASIVASDGTHHDIGSIQPTEVFAHIEAKHHFKTIRLNYPMTAEEMKITNLITDTPRTTTAPAPIVIRKKVSRRGDLMTRKELMDFRIKTFNLPTLPEEKKKKKAKKEKKRPGRKAITIVEKALEKHDFHIEFYASDVESEFEGYLSGSGDATEQYPKLKRSMSADSVFIESSYIDYFFDTVSTMHRVRFNPPETSVIERRKKKMNGIVQKHHLRFLMLNREMQCFEEMLTCYGASNFPNLNAEVKRTKGAIKREKLYKKENLPKVYRCGDEELIKTVRLVVQDLVASAVAVEKTNDRVNNGLVRSVRQAWTTHRNIIDGFKTTSTWDLPQPPYLALEILTGKRIIGEAMFEAEALHLRDQMGTMFAAYMSLEPMEKINRMTVEKDNRNKVAALDRVDYIDSREKHLDKSPKFVPIGKGSMQASDRKVEKRRVARVVHGATEREKKQAMKEQQTPLKKPAETKGVKQTPKKPDFVDEMTKKLMQETLVAQERARQNGTDREKMKAQELKKNKDSLGEDEEDEATRKAKKRQQEDARQAALEKQKLEADLRAAEVESQKKAEKERVAEEIRKKREIAAKKREDYERKQEEDAERERREQMEMMDYGFDDDNYEAGADDIPEQNGGAGFDNNGYNKPTENGRIESREEGGTSNQDFNDNFDAHLDTLESNDALENNEKRSVSLFKIAHELPSDSLRIARCQLNVPSELIYQEDVSFTTVLFLKLNIRKNDLNEYLCQYLNENPNITDPNQFFDNIAKCYRWHLDSSSWSFKIEKHLLFEELEKDQRNQLKELLSQYAEFQSESEPSSGRHSVLSHRDNPEDEVAENMRDALRVSSPTPQQAAPEIAPLAVPELAQQAPESTSPAPTAPPSAQLPTEQLPSPLHTAPQVPPQAATQSAPKVPQPALHDPLPSAPLAAPKASQDVPQALPKTAPITAPQSAPKPAPPPISKPSPVIAPQAVQEAAQQLAPRASLPPPQLESSSIECNSGFRLVETTLNDFWKLLQKLKTNKSPFNRILAQRRLAALIRVDENRKSGAEWALGVFAASCVLLIGFTYKLDANEESPFRSPSQSIIIDDNDQDLTAALTSLMDASVLFDQAFRCPQSMYMLFKLDNFSLMLAEMENMYKHIMNLFMKLRLDGIFREDIDDEQKIQNLFDAVSKKFETLLSSLCGVSQEDIQRLRTDEALFEHHFINLEAINIDDCPEEQRPRAVKHQAIIDWMKNIMDANSQLVEEIRNAAFEDFNQRERDEPMLGFREQAVPGIVEAAAEPVVLSDHTPSPAPRRNVLEEIRNAAFEDFNQRERDDPMLGFREEAVPEVVEGEADPVIISDHTPSPAPRRNVLEEIRNAAFEDFNQRERDESMLGFREPAVPEVVEAEADSDILSDHTPSPAPRRISTSESDSAMDVEQYQPETTSPDVSLAQKDVISTPEEVVIVHPEASSAQETISARLEENLDSTEATVPKTPQIEKTSEVSLVSTEAIVRKTPQAEQRAEESLSSMEATVRKMPQTEKRAHQEEEEAEGTPPPPPKKLKTNSKKAQDRPPPKKLKTDSLVDMVFKSIAGSITNLPASHKATFNKTVTAPHVSNSTKKFHAASKRSASTDKYSSQWSDFKLPIVSNEYRKFEIAILKSFSNTVVSKEKFGKLKWTVRCQDGSMKSAVEYFTDLAKYRDETLYLEHAPTGSLPFKIKLFDLQWFMGNLLGEEHDGSYHDDSLPQEFCGGCTNGDVILVHNCTCAHYNRPLSERFIYAEAVFYLPSLDFIQRVMGRFVCEHGPSSVLIFTKKEERPEQSHAVQLSRHTSHEATLPIDSSKSIHGDILKTFKEVVDHVNESIAESTPTPATDATQEVDREEVKKKIMMAHKRALNVANWENERNVKALSNALKTGRKLRVPKNRSWRSKSLDCEDRVKKPFELLTTNSSLIDLTSVEQYADKKMKEVKEKISLWEEEVSKPWSSKKRKTDADTTGSLRYFKINVLKAGEPVQFEDSYLKAFFNRLTTVHKECSLLRVQGGDKKNTPYFDGNGVLKEGKSVSAVMDEYIRFSEYARLLIGNVRSQDANNWQLLVERTDVRITPLLTTHRDVFEVNLYLLEHLLHRISQTVFTPVAMFEAERAGNIELIRRVVERVKEAIPSIVNSYFNAEPLKRQYFELMQLIEKFPKDATKIDNIVSTLQRRAIERVRVPQCADESFNKHPWVNKQSEFLESIDLLRINFGDTIPRPINFNEFLRAASTQQYNVEDIFKLSTNSFSGSPTSFIRKVLYTAFFEQSSKFYTILTRMLPEHKIDRRMKVFYSHRAFHKLYNVMRERTALTSEDVKNMNSMDAAMVYSAIMSDQEKPTVPTKTLEFITKRYNCVLDPVEEALPIPPSYIGTTFASFGTEIVVAMVCEKHVPLDGKKRDGWKTKDLVGNPLDINGKGVRISMLLNKNNDRMMVEMRPESDPRREDRLHIVLPPEILFHGDPFTHLIQNVIRPSLGNLRHQLSILPAPASPILGRLGLVEAPITENENGAANGQ